MKVLLTLAYLVLVGLSIFLGMRQQKYQIQQIGGGSYSTLWNYLWGLIVLVVIFAQFWLLTGIFPILLILLLIAASAVGAIIYIFIGAIARFTLEEKKRKIGALGVIWGAQNPILGCTFGAFSFLILLVIVIGSLWTFWSHSYGDPKALLWIAFFQFVLPQIVFIPFFSILLWPVVTSEYLDDDLRNSYLAGGFSAIFYRAIYLLFPLWLFKKEIVGVFQLDLPPFWVLLSIPLLLFIFGSLVMLP